MSLQVMLAPPVIIIARRTRRMKYRTDEYSIEGRLARQVATRSGFVSIWPERIQAVLCGEF
jgi:hypothetical protein